MQTDEVARKALRSAKAKKRYWSDPEIRAKSIEKARLRIRLYRESPEYCKREREQQAQYKAKPEVKSRESLRNTVWKRINREAVNKNARIYLRRKRATDMNYRLKQNLRHLLGEALRRKQCQKKTKTEAALGCSYQVFVRYIEDRFLPGMSWTNRSKWHLDHFTPLALASTEEQIYDLSHYTNLSPIWGSTNQSKSDSIPPGPIIERAAWAYDVISAGKEG